MANLMQFEHFFCDDNSDERCVCVCVGGGGVGLRSGDGAGHFNTLNCILCFRVKTRPRIRHPSLT